MSLHPGRLLCSSLAGVRPLTGKLAWSMIGRSGVWLFGEDQLVALGQQQAITFAAVRDDQLAVGAQQIPAANRPGVIGLLLLPFRFHRCRHLSSRPTLESPPF